jgi:hypothetical protein
MTSPENNHLVEVHLAEKAVGESVDRMPGGSIRYIKTSIPLKKGTHLYRVRIPKDKRNTSDESIRLPQSIGVIMPFRYCEITNCPGKLKKSMIRQIAVHYPFNNNASHFTSSDHILNDVWELCKYSIKATSFCGIYIDGDRERKPYEGDSSINQITHYSVDREFTLARNSHEYLLRHSTWPTEWKMHSVFMAWADYLYTGNIESLSESYDILKTKKTLESQAREDGLLNTQGMRDITDWPPGERDGFKFSPINTVVNAFYYKTSVLMADIACALGKQKDTDRFQGNAEKVKKAFNEKLFDKKRGVYMDGEGQDHSSLHANMFPLAFGLVPEERRKSVVRHIKSRGMACSVYGAQYLLEALYEAGEEDYALSLMTSMDVRSWYNMIKKGATITLEAWDVKFKSNLDWNHAWGAAPGNIIPRFLMGVRPLAPGFEKILIEPRPGWLKSATATIPTIRGPVHVAFENDPKKPFVLEVQMPGNTQAIVSVPAGKESDVIEGGKPSAKCKCVEFLRMERGRALFSIGSGKYRFVVRR